MTPAVERFTAAILDGLRAGLTADQISTAIRAAAKETP